jgi:hypothetical protein
MAQISTIHRTSIEEAAPYLEIGRELGEFDGISVFEAQQIDRDQRILLQVLPVNQSTLGKTASQVERSVAKLQTLHHVNVPTIYGGGVAEDTVFIETEFFRGRFLKELVGERVLTLRQALELAAQVSGALEYLHSQGIGYAELLPHGVYIGREKGTLRLTAKLIRADKFRALKPDGREQRAFALFLKSLLAAVGSRNRGAINDSITNLTISCAAESNVPSFSTITTKLRDTLERVRNDAANQAVHVAEPLDLKPPEIVKPTSDGLRGIHVVAVVVTAVLIAIGLAIFLPKDAFQGNQRRNGQRSVSSSPSSSPMRPRTGSANDGGSPVSSPQPRRRSMPDNYTYHFSPSHDFARAPRGGSFAQPKLGSSAASEPVEVFKLSNAAWDEDRFNDRILTVECSSTGSGDGVHLIRLLWVIETKQGKKFEAHMFGNSEIPDKLRGEIHVLAREPLEGEFQTYLLEEGIGFREPRRVSNILNVEPPPSDD